MSANGTAPAADDPKEKAEVERLCAEYLAFAIGETRRYRRRYPALADEFESEATLALLNAARKRHTFNGSFARLVGMYVSTACEQLMDRERRRPDSSLNNDEDDQDDARAEREEDDEEDGFERPPHADPVAGLLDQSLPVEQLIQNEETVSRLLSRIPKSHAAILRRHYFDGESFTEIAEAMGKDRSAVSKMAHRALARLRKVAEEEFGAEGAARD